MANTPPTTPTDDRPFVPNVASSVDTTPAAPPEPEGPAYLLAQLPDLGPGVPNLPFVIACTDKAIEEADAAFGGIYYIMGSTDFTNGEVGAKLRKWTQATIYRRVRNATGDSLISMNSMGTQLHLPTLVEKANFSLPKIPWTQVDEMEYFFREVYKIHGSEAIVMLTYDATFADTENPSEGWGFFAPDQENTGAHCKYVPESIVEHKPPHVDIVGSAHSHPNMSAFASHTDAGDQFNNDGLHITFGWPKGQIEYHIEYQVANRRFDAEVTQVFEMGAKETYDIDHMLARVKKATPAVTNTWQRNTTPGGGGSPQSSFRPPTGSPDARIYGLWYREQFNDARPNGCPNLVENIVIAMVRDDEKCCPACGRDFDVYTPRNQRCTQCFTYLLLPGQDDPMQIHETRKVAYANKAYIPGLEFLIGGTSLLPVQIWDRRTDTPEGEVRQIHDPKATTTPEAEAPKALPSET